MAAPTTAHRRPTLRAAHGQVLSALPAGPHGAMPQGTRRECWNTLMACACDPGSPEIMALAGVLATAYGAHGLHLLPLVGLPAASTRHMLARWFPGAEQSLGLNWPALAQAHRPEPRDDEIDEVLSLLLEHARPDPSVQEETRWLAHAIAQGCLGDDHLWQDLHLPSRRELSSLFRDWFPPLAARNDRDMKWKKFLYKQLCDRAQVHACRAPSCAVCTDYAVCFGPEEAVAA